MNKYPLVSILSPCYNGETYIERFLKSVLDQDWPFIELILVDDGSTDKTRLIINSYKLQFINKGYILKYIYQVHAGQAEAINKALSVCDGEYLTWIDSDDLLKKASISKRIEFLKNNPQFEFCCCGATFVDENNLEQVLFEKKRIPDTESQKLFFDLIYENNVIFQGVYMVARRAFFKAIPSGKIYPSIEGQNWQLLLPLAYHYECGYLDESLIKVVQRKSSHSRIERTPYQILERYKNFQEIFSHVFDSLDCSKKDELMLHVHVKYARAILRLACDFDIKDIAREKYLLLKKNDSVSVKDRIFYFLSKYRFFIPAYKLLRYFKHMLLV